MGEVGNTTVEVMFDSGSAVSLLRKSDMNQMSSVQHMHKQPRVRLITAAGEPLPVVGLVQVPVQVGNFKTTHDFLVVDCLIYPVILGVYFLHKNALTLDFTSTPVSVYHSGTVLETSPEMGELWNREQHAKSKRCAAAIASDESPNMIDDCSIPKYGNAPQFDVPCCVDDEINTLLTKYQCLFKTVQNCSRCDYIDLSSHSHNW